MIKTILKTTLAAGFAVAVTGCASNAALQSQVDDAADAAASAQSTAETALQKANHAQRTAEQALRAAHDAKATAQANSERMERMFKASQSK